MSTPVISGDSIFSHVFIGAADVQKSAAFYDVTLGALGIKNLGPFGNGWVLFGREKPAFIIARPGNGEAPSSNGVTIGFAAATPAEVDAFHAAGLAAGGTDEGSLARVATCRAPTQRICVIRPATRSARTPLSRSSESDGIRKELAQASIGASITQTL
jgi:catechol 2,3-dioxygenase-like lactoylglutathione lyase family enzyme